MPLEKKFDEDSTVVSVRVPKSRKDEYKKIIKDVIDERYKREKKEGVIKKTKRN